MRTLLASIFAAASLCCISSAAEAVLRPNVILIMADDFGYECVTANGGESYRTPNLDKLAAGGMRFENCHAQPLCTPTRVALMTGMANVRNYTRFGHLDPGQTTFGSLFKNDGYATCITGKWQLGQDFSLPGRFGFDDYCLWQLTRRPERYKNPGLEINGKEIDFTNGEYGPDVVNDHALAFIEAQRERNRPFFLYYPMILTHDPFVPTPDSESYAEGRGKKSGGARHFADMVAYMDKLIGRLTAKLDELGLRENTLILFTGDNGTGRGVLSRFQGRDVKGGKGATNTFGTHVPLIASWPGKIPTGQVCGDLVDATDFLPTICEAAGVTVPSELRIDGRSFWPQLRGEKGQPREWLYSWYNRGGGKNASAEFARDHRYKLYSDGRLLDVRADELEMHPLEEASLTAEAKAAKTKLQGAINQFRDARPEEIARQGGPGGGGKGGGKKRKKK